MTQTDDLLRKLYDQLRNSGSSFSLVYFSDHGLAFKERGKDVKYLAHDDQYQPNFQVPFMVISSDDKAHRVIQARRSANDFLGFFSQWTGIKAKEINIKYPVSYTHLLLKRWDLSPQNVVAIGDSGNLSLIHIFTVDTGGWRIACVAPGAIHSFGVKR